MPNPHKDCFLHNLYHKIINHQKVWMSDDRKRFYTWDYTHGDVEVFDSIGNHMGSADPVSGARTKKPVRGRRIDV